jgi:hypothetical protein
MQLPVFLNYKKNVMIAGAVTLVIIIGVIMLMGRNAQTSKQSSTSQEQSDIQNEPTIAPVSSSVKVSLTPVKAGKEVKIMVANPPSGTEKMEYELSYDSSNRGSQGAIGELKGSSHDATVTLGTCSSGTCIYDSVTGPLKLSIKFSGSYGEQIFEKDYDLSQ